MMIIGCDYHPGFQQIAFVDTETGELPGGPTHRALCDVWVLRHRTVSEITITTLLVGPLTVVKAY
jgi:hypothetical protein